MERPPLLISISPTIPALREKAPTCLAASLSERPDLFELGCERKASSTWAIVLDLVRDAHPGEATPCCLVIETDQGRREFSTLPEVEAFMFPVVRNWVKFYGRALKPPPTKA